MSAEKFWSGWLKITMLIVIIAGILLAVMANIIQWRYLDEQINRVFFGNEYQSEPVEMLKRWLIGISGAVMAGWGCSMLYVVHHPFRRKEQWAWRCIFYPVIIWYIIDTSVSTYFGADFNVIINSILLLQIIAPLMFLHNQFFPKLETV
jgi:ABC-type multidrug transport system permease subunit